jgi:hypothetical protein
MNESKIILESPNVICSSCGSKLFESVYVLKRVSSIYTGTQNAQLQPIPLFRCADCHTIVQDYLDNKNAKYIFGDVDNKTADDEVSTNKSTLII